MLYLAWYGFERFFVEGIRSDSLWLVPGVIRVSQLLAAILFVSSLAVFLFMHCYWMKKHPNRDYLFVQTADWQKVLTEKEKRKR